MVRASLLCQPVLSEIARRARLQCATVTNLAAAQDEPQAASGDEDDATGVERRAQSRFFTRSAAAASASEH